MPIYLAPAINVSSDVLRVRETEVLCVVPARVRALSSLGCGFVSATVRPLQPSVGSRATSLTADRDSVITTAKEN
jgi:hypothetical protein